MAKGKTQNPADAFRKAQRAKELKKNKEHRKQIREAQVIKKDTRDLEEEIKSLKSNSKLKDHEKSRLSELESELKYIIKTKEAYVKEHPEAKDRVFKKYNGPRRLPGYEDDDASAEGSGSRAGLYDEHGRLRDPTRSVYYDAVYNPFGVPPPGMPYKERTPEPEDSDEEDDEDEDDEEDSEEEIIMPEGPPPLPKPNGNDEDGNESDDSDDIPLPAGPPPPRTLPSQLPPQPPIPQLRPPMYFTGPPGAHPLPFAPPLSGHGRPRPPPPNQMPRAARTMQDPLSDAPTQTYQGYRMDHAGLPAKPSPPANAPNGPSGSTLPPKPSNGSATTSTIQNAPLAGTISAEPQLRDLRKEATVFVPRGVKRKAPTGTSGTGNGKVMSRINAAPGAGEVDEDGDEVRVKHLEQPGLMGVLKGVLADVGDTSKVGGHGGGGKEDDDYQKFLEGLNDLG